jgi:stage III sporulation protein SpoIIIAA
VCIVDTSNEIGGEGDIPHTSVGEARRMMVTSLEAQAKIMVRCVQVRLNTVSATRHLFLHLNCGAAACVHTYVSSLSTNNVSHIVNIIIAESYT